MKAALQGEIHYQNNHPGKGKGAAYTWVSSRTSTGPHHMLWSWCCCASRCSLQPPQRGTFPCSVLLPKQPHLDRSSECDDEDTETTGAAFSFSRQGEWVAVYSETLFYAWQVHDPTGDYSKMPQTHQKIRLSNPQPLMIFLEQMHILCLFWNFNVAPDLHKIQEQGLRLTKPTEDWTYWMAQTK